jgi:hypothetical protein
MRTINRVSSRVPMTVLCAVSATAIAVGATPAAAAAKPITPVPVCAGAKDLVVDVSQDVRNQPFLPARDGHMWANFSYTQHLRIWTVGARQYCVRKDVEGTWTSIAGLSPGLTGTISDGLTGTFTDTTYWEWTGTLTPIAATMGHLGTVNADCTAVNVCADDNYLIADTYYFTQGTQHCNSVRRDLEVDGGEHGRVRRLQGDAAATRRVLAAYDRPARGHNAVHQVDRAWAPRPPCAAIRPTAQGC